MKKATIIKKSSYSVNGFCVAKTPVRDDQCKKQLVDD